MMNAAFEQQIRERAYEIWMAGGRENGSADAHWLSAERSMMNEAARPCAEVVVPKAAAPKVAASKVGASKPASAGAKKVAMPRAAKAVETAMPPVTVRKRAKAKPDIHA